MSAYLAPGMQEFVDELRAANAPHPQTLPLAVVRQNLEDQAVRWNAFPVEGVTHSDGHIAGLGAGTGAAFSLLPAQNATGNWIKIVQRVPVRVALDAGELAEHPLRVGLSMTATVDVRDRSGPAVAGSPQGSQPASVTTVYDALDTAADERVDAIVSRNLGRNVHLRRAR